MIPEIRFYHDAHSDSDKEICDRLFYEINKVLSAAENKIWHAIPVWLIERNPIVGYGKLKGCIRLLFWSGQSFDEDVLQNEGKFKAAEIRYTDVSQINSKDLQRILKKSIKIQWDYKNIIKRKGALIRLK